MGGSIVSGVQVNQWATLTQAVGSNTLSVPHKTSQKGLWLLWKMFFSVKEIITLLHSVLTKKKKKGYSYYLLHQRDAVLCTNQAPYISSMLIQPNTHDHMMPQAQLSQTMSGCSFKLENPASPTQSPQMSLLC